MFSLDATWEEKIKRIIGGISKQYFRKELKMITLVSIYIIFWRTF
jgi:hypothetical protein